MSLPFNNPLLRIDSFDHKRQHIKYMMRNGDILSVIFRIFYNGGITIEDAYIEARVHQGLMIAPNSGGGTITIGVNQKNGSIEIDTSEYDFEKRKLLL